MAKVLVVGNNSYLFPEQSDNPLDSFWGENVTNWATDITEQVNSFSVLLPEAQQTLNNAATNSPIALLDFDPTLYRRVEVEFALIRNSVRETGYMTLISTGASWDYNLEYDTSAVSDVTLNVVGNTVSYSSGTVVGVSSIRFRATGITA
jgi:hypothetical protein